MNPENAVGKPFTIKVGEDIKTLGEVSEAKIKDGHLLLAVKLDLTDA